MKDTDKHPVPAHPEASVSALPATPAPARTSSGERRVDQARFRIAADYYRQEHVRERILEALLRAFEE